MEQKRYDYLDLFKCIAILMVMSLHSLLWTTDFIKGDSFGLLIQWCLRLLMEGVPIFIFINGFLIIGKEKLDIKKHYKKVLKIFLLYIFWGIVTFCIISLIHHKSINIAGLYNNIISVSVNTQYTGHLWFLQFLISLYLIYPLINNIYINDEKSYNVFLLIIAFFTFVPSFLNIIFPNTLLDDYINKFIPFSPINNLIFLFYFMFGGFVKKNLDWFKKRRIVLIIVAIVLYILSCLFGIYKSYADNVVYSHNYIYYQIVFAFIIIGILMLIINYKDKNKLHNKIIKSIGKNTLGIYLIHPIIISACYKFIHFNYGNFLLRLALLLGVFIVTYLLVLLISKIPKVNNIIKL